MTGGAGHLPFASAFKRLPGCLRDVQKDRAGGGVNLLPAFAIGADEGYPGHRCDAPLSRRALHARRLIDRLCSILQFGPCRITAKADPHRSPRLPVRKTARRSEEHTSELQSLMRTPYAAFC